VGQSQLLVAAKAVS